MFVIPVKADKGTGRRGDKEKKRRHSGENQNPEDIDFDCHSGPRAGIQRC